MLKFIILLIVPLIGTVCGLYPSSGDVMDLTPANFDRLVKDSDSVWLVEFYAPWCGHCKNLVPEYSKVAKALKGVAKVGAVNADEHKSLSGQYGVSGFPTIKIFGQNKNSPEAYNGARTASDMADAVLKAVKSKVNAQLNGKSGGGSSKSDSSDVVELTDANFDKLVMNSEDLWLVEFFAPWCGHCKNLEPQWAKAATDLKGKVRLGALDATVHQVKASQYGVQGYPTIKVFAAGKKDSDSVSEYTGGRTSGDIVNWALEKLAENIPPPELLQIVNEKSVEEACGNQPLCVFSVLPHILDCDAECRNKYLDILRSMADKYKQKMWGWVWSEGGAQPAVEEALEIGGFGYPAMAVVNQKKLKFSILRGSFSEQGINEFLRDLSFGRGQTSPVKGAEMPKILETDPWDGKDGVLPQEEEIDLSDVVFSDEKDEL